MQWFLHNRIILCYFNKVQEANVKVKVFVILAGVAALHLLLIAGFAVSGGCKGPEVFAERKYIPAKVATDKPADAAAVPAEKVSVSTAEKMPAVKKSTPALVPDKAPVMVPDKAPAVTVPPVHKTGDTYKVQNGDSLSKIAKTHGVSVAALAASNNIESTKMLKIGQTLVIPAPGSSTAVHETKKAKPAVKKDAKPAAKKDSKDAKKDGEKDSAKPEEKSAEKTDAAATDAAKDSYVVKKGDSVPLIAKKLHVKASDLRKANNLKETSKLTPGQKLVVPVANKAGEADKEDAKTKESTDDIVNNVPSAGAAVDAAAPAVKPAAPAVGPAAAPATDTKTAPAAASNSPAGKEAVEVDKATTIEAFAQKYGVKVEDIKKLNPDLAKDGKLTVGKIVIIPAPAN
jgi:LysM repeat protein